MAFAGRRALSKKPQRLLRITSIAGGIAVLAALAPIVPASADINFTIDGSWFCNNRGDVRPVAGARVEFWQQVSSFVDWFDKHISDTHTNTNGQYSQGFSSGHQHDFYARLVLNDDQGARLHNWWTGSSWGIDTGTGSNTSGTIHHDLVISKDGGSSTPKCAIWQGARNAYQEYVGTVGVAPPDSLYDISLETTIFPTPWTTLETTHWPDGYTTMGGGPNSPYPVNFHEFAHSVRHSFDGDFGHFLFDVARFGYIRQHAPCDKSNLGFAFNEGWAEFWATDWGATPPAAPSCGASTTDMEREGNVAAALYGLSTCTGVGRAGMVAVLQGNPGAIHSFDEFANALDRSFPECRLGVLRQGEVIPHNVGEEVALSIQARAAATLVKISLQNQVTDALIRSYRAAVAAAALARPCETVPTCDALFQVVTAPSLLAGRIAQSKQVTARLQNDLRQLSDQPSDEDQQDGSSSSMDQNQEQGRSSHLDESGQDGGSGRMDEDDEDGGLSLANAALYRRHASDQKAFDRRTLTAVITATRRALAALRPFVKRDPTGTLAAYMADLRQSLADFQNRRDRGLTPPESLQPPGGSSGEASALCGTSACSPVL
jgi:hypothetical protein